jgi:hypothetical protein
MQDSLYTAKVYLEEESNPSLQNPAVIHCVQAWKTAQTSSLASGRSAYRSGADGVSAYCAAMPPLSGYQNICDFIVCVGYALTARLIPEDISTKYLYAAQVALSTIPARDKKTGKCKIPPSPLLPQPAENKRIKPINTQKDPSN